MDTKVAAHTPGPWTVGGQLISRVGTDVEIAMVLSNGKDRRYSPKWHEADANAALIAAAPDLLEVCDALDALIEDGQISYMPSAGCWIERLQQALAKAKGGA